MAALQSRPQVAANTVVVFTSDHGEYGASHGLRGKGGGVYEEAIRVPLIVKDLRGRLNAAPSIERTGLDLERRRRAAAADDRDRLERLAARLPLRSHRRPARHRADALRSRGTGSRDGAARHRRDRERVRDRALRDRTRRCTWSRSAPRQAKYAVYSNWESKTNTVQSAGQERELYDYSSRNGVMELDNVAGASHLEPALDAQLASAVRKRAARTAAHAACRQHSAMATPTTT